MTAFSATRAFHVSRESKALRWVPLCQLLTMSVPAPVKRMVHKALSHPRSIS